MLEPTTLSFVIKPFEGTLSVTPAVNGSLLSDLVLGFEREHHFEPAGGYGGLVPTWFDYGPLHSYFLADFAQGNHFAQQGSIYLLGCQCGEVGCWPLEWQGTPKKTARSSGHIFNNYIAQNVTIHSSDHTFLQNRSTWTHWRHLSVTCDESRSDAI